MFAKFSPDGRRVGYVRENNLYVEDLAGGDDHRPHHRRVAHAHQRHLRLGVRRRADELLRRRLALEPRRGPASPSGSSTPTRSENFALINNTDSVYSRVTEVQYPKVGETNSAARVGVVSAAGGATRWLETEGDPRNHYIARMEWAASSDEVILQRLNRLQNRNEVMLGDARTGKVRTVLVEQDSTWVDLWWTIWSGWRTERASPG